ncbi:GGDEF domain-containing protein [Pseudomonas putida]
MVTSVDADAEQPPKPDVITDERFHGLTRLAQRHFGVTCAILMQLQNGQPSLRASSGTPPPAHPEDPQCHALITAEDGQPLGEFILLGRNQLHPGEQQLLQDLVHLAAAALQAEQRETALKHELHALRESQDRLALAIDNSGTGVWDRDVLHNQIHYSPGWKALLGYEPHELTPHLSDSYNRVHPDDLPFVQATIQAHFQQRTSAYEVEHRIRCKDGTYKWINSRGKVVARDADGNPLRMIGTTTDITERKRLEADLQLHASIDFLTQLPNRRHFMQQLVGQQHNACVLMLDLDHFKHINDRWGHATGDLALKHFANILSGQLRKTDVAGRIGGEEFAVLLRETHSRDACVFAVRLQERLAVTPLMHGGQVIGLTVSIGVSDLREGDEGAEAAMGRSDRALYRAKASGRNRVVAE